MTTRVAVVVSGFPRTSETFAIGELNALADAGMLVRVYATKPGDGADPQPGVAELLPLVRWLPEGDVEVQARAVADDLRVHRVDGIHGYFAHRPAEVAGRAADLMGVRASFSSHALDARKVPAAELSERARSVAGVVACNDDVARYLDVPGAAMRLLPHGVDTDRFAPRLHPPGDGRLRLLAVGRLVEKKGFPVLLEAVARLQVACTLRLVGSGVQHRLLDDLSRDLGIEAMVDLVGRRSHADLPDDYAWADVVVVPSVVDSSGDRDGLPNVVLEAMASARAVVVSDVAALGAVVRQAEGGIVVAPGNPTSLSTAVATLTDPQRRARLGEGGRRHVLAHYDLSTCTARFVDHLAGLHAHVPEALDA